MRTKEFVFIFFLIQSENITKRPHMVCCHLFNVLKYKLLCSAVRQFKQNISNINLNASLFNIKNDHSQWWRLQKIEFWIQFQKLSKQKRFKKQHSHVSQVLERFKHLSVNVPNFDSLNAPVTQKAFSQGLLFRKPPSLAFQYSLYNALALFSLFLLLQICSFVPKMLSGSLWSMT